MADNRGVAYMGTGKVEVQISSFRGFELYDGPGVNPANVGRQLPHGAILECVSTNICGSDQHMVRGRTTAPEGLMLGHEITGEVIETGPDVEFIKVGDLVLRALQHGLRTLPHACRNGNTGVCLNVNPEQPGAAYGYVDMGGWVGGQAEYVLVPYADFNLLKFPDKAQAMEKITDLTMLSDIFPTGYHGAVTAGVDVGSTVYIAGAGPVGMAAATSAQLSARRWSSSATDRGAAGPGEEVRVRDGRHLQGRPKDQIAQILGEPVVDAAVDAVGFEASGHGRTRSRRRRQRC